MPAEPPALAGDAVTLLPVASGEVAALAAGDLGDLVAGRGWPHEDTTHGLAFATHGGLAWLVADATGAVVGELGTKGPPDAAGAVEIGYGLAAPSRGRGLGTRAVATLLGWLDTRPEVRVVVAHVDRHNVASARLLERLGFLPAGEHGPQLRYERPHPG